MNVTIPSAVRKWLYIIFGFLGAVQTAAYSAYAAIHLSPPTQLVAGSAAFASLSAAPFLVAILNIQKVPTTQTDADTSALAAAELEASSTAEPAPAAPTPGAVSNTPLQPTS